MLVWTARARVTKKTLLTMEIMRIMATTTARMTETVTLVITSTMATMMMQTMVHCPGARPLSAGPDPGSA